MLGGVPWLTAQKKDLAKTNSNEPTTSSSIKSSLNVREEPLIVELDVETIDKLGEKFMI